MTVLTNTWKFNINEEKTKVVVFGSRSKQFTFTLGNSELFFSNFIHIIVTFTSQSKQYKYI